MDIHRDIDSLTNFKRNTPGFLKQLKDTGEPVVLTINGKAELVVQDAKSYQKLMEIAERAEELESLRVSVEEMKAGKGRPIEEMFAEMENVLAAARAGRYANDDEVIRDTPTQLKKTLPKATPVKRTKRVQPVKPQEKPLTRDEFNQRLMAEGLVTSLPDPALDIDDDDDPPIVIKGEPLSETIIGERR